MRSWSSRPGSSLTSVGQTYLDQPLNAFVNSASAWLVVPFAAGLWVYLHELHYYDTAALWIGIGALIVVALARGFKDLRWLALTVPVGLLAEVLLVLVYSQAS